jgi:glycosyltransferase involved in cell wall biosynthesis
MIAKPLNIAQPTADGLPIYVEASPLLTRHLTGVGRFAARVVEALCQRREVRLVNTVQGDHARNMRLSNALRCGQEIILARGQVPAAAADVAAWARALFHAPLHKHDYRLARDCTILYTMLRPGERHFRRELCLLHDFTTMLMPKLHVPETTEHFGRLFHSRAALCDKLLANSHSTRNDATWLCACPADDVVVSYPGPTLCTQEHFYGGTVRRRDNAIIAVSTLEPRKNSAFLFRWFLNTRVLDANCELWWVGPRGWLLDRLLPRRRRSLPGRKIKLLGMVPDRQLCKLYREATFSVYPSLYEGFGFPVLDSLRHGTPVAASFNSSLQEFAGPGVHYFDPCDPASLDNACLELMRTRRPSLKRTDLEQRFSWERMADKILALSA